jgi:hypothetical protein
VPPAILWEFERAHVRLVSTLVTKPIGAATMPSLTTDTLPQCRKAYGNEAIVQPSPTLGGEFMIEVTGRTLMPLSGRSARPCGVPRDPADDRALGRPRITRGRPRIGESARFPAESFGRKAN